MAIGCSAEYSLYTSALSAQRPPGEGEAPGSSLATPNPDYGTVVELVS